VVCDDVIQHFEWDIVSSCRTSPFFLFSPIEKFVEGVGVGVGGESFSFIPVENENAMHTHQEFQ
jgi:hypothetical protein